MTTIERIKYVEILFVQFIKDCQAKFDTPSKRNKMIGKSLFASAESAKKYNDDLIPPSSEYRESFIPIYRLIGTMFVLIVSLLLVSFFPREDIQTKAVKTMINVECVDQI